MKTMGNKAVLALSNKNGTFDMFYSHNGAYNLQLYPILQITAGMASHPDYSDVLTQMKSPNMKKGTKRRKQMELLQEGLTQRSDHPVNTADYDELVEPDPFATEVPPEKLTEKILPNREAVFVVEDGWCRVFRTIWMSFDLLPWLKRYVEIELYERASLQSLKQLSVLQDRRPRHSFSGDDYRTIAMNPEKYQREYPALLRTCQFVGSELLQISKSRPHSNNDKNSTIVSDDWIFKSTLTSDADPEQITTTILLRELPIYNLDSIEEFPDPLQFHNRIQEILFPVTRLCTLRI